MGFRELPAELQLEIFSYLDNVSLKAARAVSRKCRDNASPALFRSIVACARYEALGAYQNISLNSVLQKYVKEIVFDGSVYQEEPAQSEQLYERETQNFLDLGRSSFWGNRTRWQRYKELYKEQEDLKNSETLLQTMARALEWTTNVTSIVYSPHPHSVPAESKVIRDLLPRGLPLPDHTVNFFPFPSPIKREHPFRHVIGAVYTAQYTGIRELRIEPFRVGEPGTPFTLSILDFQKAIDFKAGKHLFQGLERCELHFHSWVQPRDQESQHEVANLRRMLVAATELRHLVLYFTDVIAEHEAVFALRSPEHTMISRLGLTDTWPKLRSLSLGGIFMHAEDLLDLIRRHRYTLYTLYLRRCVLHPGFWADIVDEVLYSTRILPFSLDKVRELTIPVGEGEVQSTAGLEEWQYEGHAELSTAGERIFVESIREKKSVYFLRKA